MEQKFDWLEKIGEWNKPIEEYQKIIFCDDILWFFGQKYFERPNYHWGNYVTFNGAHSDFFDINKKIWGGPKKFESISSEQHLAEIIFISDKKIFLLLFNNFGAIYFHSMYQFNKEKRCWELFFEFSEEKTIPSDNDRRNNLLYAGDFIQKPNELSTYYFVSYEDFNINIYLIKYEIKENKINLFWEKFDVPKNYFQGFQPTNAILINKTIFVQGGILCCGFRWQPNWLLKLTRKETELIKFESKISPAFNYSGSYANAIGKDKNSWIHFAGTKQYGMSGCTFNGEIWVLENLIENNQPKWKKLENRVIPKMYPGRAGIIYLTESDQLFILDDKNRILKSIKPLI